ncbi:MAG: protein phosphatase CheZ [Alphaproteobacteria bacterium]
MPAYEKDQVLKIINSVIDKIGRNSDFPRDAIYSELSELKKIIDTAKADIGSVRPSDITDTHIPIATDELDAVVEATAEATGHIMDACEVIEEKAGAIGGDNGDIICAEVTKIYEACSFQDITGQRITKVVGALKDIETKVNILLDILSNKMPGLPDSSDNSPAKTPPSTIKDDDLLNGPQMPDKAITQDDIDKLLAEFD